MKSPVRNVRRDVGLNPVARAVALQSLKTSILDSRIALFMLSEGEGCLEQLCALPLIIRATLLAMRDQSSPDARKLMSADIVMGEISERGTWREVDTITLNNALEIVLRVWPTLTPRAANDALRFAQKELA